MSAQRSPCPEPQCNQADGHEEPHGLAIVLAPAFGTGVGPWEAVDLRCNACGKGSIQMRRFREGGGQFHCPCGQDVRVLVDSTSQTKRDLYPSEVSRWPAAMHHQFADYEMRQRDFVARARWLTGLISIEERDRRLADAADAVARYKAEHPLPGPRPSRAPFLWRWLRRRSAPRV